MGPFHNPDSGSEEEDLGFDIHEFVDSMSPEELSAILADLNALDLDVAAPANLPSAAPIVSTAPVSAAPDHATLAAPAAPAQAPVTPTDAVPVQAAVPADASPVQSSPRPQSAFPPSVELTVNWAGGYRKGPTTVATKALSTILVSGYEKKMASLLASSEDEATEIALMVDSGPGKPSVKCSKKDDTSLRVDFVFATSPQEKNAETWSALPREKVQEYIWNESLFVLATSDSYFQNSRKLLDILGFPPQGKIGRLKKVKDKEVSATAPPDRNEQDELRSAIQSFAGSKCRVMISGVHNENSRRDIKNYLGEYVAMKVSAGDPIEDISEQLITAAGKKNDEILKGTRKGTAITFRQLREAVMFYPEEQHQPELRGYLGFAGKSGIVIANDQELLVSDSHDIDAFRRHVKKYMSTSKKVISGATAEEPPSLSSEEKQKITDRVTKAESSTRILPIRSHIDIKALVGATLTKSVSQELAGARILDQSKEISTNSDFYFLSPFVRGVIREYFDSFSATVAEYARKLGRAITQSARDDINSEYAPALNNKKKYTKEDILFDLDFSCNTRAASGSAGPVIARSLRAVISTAESMDTNNLRVRNTLLKKSKNSCSFWVKDDLVWLLMDDKSERELYIEKLNIGEKGLLTRKDQTFGSDLLRVTPPRLKDSVPKIAKALGRVDKKLKVVAG